MYNLLFEVAAICSHFLYFGSILIANLGVDMAGSSNSINTPIIVKNNQVTRPLQCAFFAQLNASLGNVTGDGTVFQIPCNNVVFDQSSSYNPSNGVFTAPVTGNYLFGASINTQGLTSSMNVYVLKCMTTAREYRLVEMGAYVPSSASQTLQYAGCIFARMNADETAYFTIRVAGGSKVVSLQAAGISFIYGYLLD